MPDFDPDAYLAKNGDSGGFDPDAYLAKHADPAPAQPNIMMLGTRAVDLDSLRATIRGGLDMVPFSHKFIAAADATKEKFSDPSLTDLISNKDRSISGLYDKHLSDTDALYAKEKGDNTTAFRTGQVGGALALPIPKGIGGMAAFGAAQGAGDSRGGILDLIKNAGLGGTAGGVLGGAGKLIAKGAGAAGAAAMPWLQRVESRLTNQIGDKAVKGAEETANSAFGSFRSSRADANRILELLQKKTGDAAIDARSDAILKSPQGQRLIQEVVKGAQDRAPEALNNIDSLRALHQQKLADIPAARAAATSNDALSATMAQRTKDQVKRYVIPAVGAAAGGAVGGPVGAGLGAAAGRGVSPGVNAVVMNNALAPERRLLATRSSLNVAAKLSKMATAQPKMLGRFALPLARATERGPDAVAAAHYVLSQEPDYQEIMHAAAKDNPNGD